MAIEWEEVVSSNIEAIGYDADERELHVRFNYGAEYVYHDVPSDVVLGFLAASSKGKYLADHIKGKYEFAKKVG